MTTRSVPAGHPFLDLVCLALEPPPLTGEPLSCYPLGSDHSPLVVTPAAVTCLRQEVFVQGQVREHPHQQGTLSRGSSWKTSLALGLVFIVPQENEGTNEYECTGTWYSTLNRTNQNPYIMMILKHQKSGKLESMETNAEDDTIKSMEAVLRET